VRTQGRSARIVGDVLVATAEELGRVGYAALRVDDIAARSGVNKTTIYRRWPTKVDLVAAALRELSDVPAPPDTGSLREDLLAMLRVACARASSPLKQGIFRAILLEQTHPEVDAVTRTLRSEHLAPRKLVIERAIRRGELPREVDVELLLELVFGPVMRRTMITKEPVNDAFIHYVVDVVLAGARAVAARRTK
jgi:AcrR family transcriptional regulator